MNIIVQSCGLLLLLILLYFYYRHKRLNLDSENAFMKLMLFNVLTLIMDISSVICIVYAHSIPQWLLYVVCKGYLISLVSMTYIALLYETIDIYDNKHSRIRKRSVWIYNLIYLIGVISVAILPINYYYDKVSSDLYTYGLSVLMTYALAGTFIIINIANMYYYRSVINRRRRDAMTVWLVMWIMAAEIQFFNNQLLIVGFAAALGCMVAYLILENPEANIDRDTGLFNQNGLRLYLHQLYSKQEEFSLVTIVFEYTNSNYEDEKTLQYIKKKDRKSLLDYLLNVKFGYVFYNLGNEIMVVFENQALFKEGLTEINNRFEQLRQRSEIGIRLRYIVAKDAYLLENEEQLLEYIAHCRTLQKSTVEKEIIFLDQELMDKIRNQLEVEKMVEKAIKENRVEVFYQPIYSITEKRFHSAEALARIRTEDGQLIMPGVFIEFAEKNGMIVHLGEQIFEQVCQFISSEAYQELDLEYIEVNLSVVQCGDEGLAKRYIEIMEKYKIPASSINLEITESASVQAKKILLENMRQLRDYGVSFSLDDFGTGQSNLNYIAEMPIDIVKFDREMTMAYFEDDRFRHVIRSAVNMIDGMGMEIVLEGIEEKMQLDEMERLAVDYIQGYYFSKPLAREDFCKFILTTNKRLKAQK